MLEVNKNKFIKGQAFEIVPEDVEFPGALKILPDAPKKLYLIGNPHALKEGIAIVGARRATPYGLSCTKHFASIAAKEGIVVISGGAYGCDSASHRAALKNNGQTVVFLGGGCNEIYPPKNFNLYQEIVDKNGAIVSEEDWDKPAMRHTFLNRNRLIAGLAKATLICEAGLPSGTFSTADYALKYNKELMVVPGPITNENSAGCNKLIYDGAIPIINNAVFYEEISKLYSSVNFVNYSNTVRDYENHPHKLTYSNNPILDALQAQAMTMDDLYNIAKSKCKTKNPSVWLSEKLIEAEQSGLVSKYPNGMYGPVYKT